MLTLKRFSLAVLCVAMLAGPLRAEQDPPATGSEADLIAVLRTADAPMFEKAKACQRLATIGTAECVPVLADMLSDGKIAHYARYALEPNPDPAVDEALRNALDELDGSLLVGVINSVAVRRDAKAVPKLSELMQSSDNDVAAAAAAALGRIATPEALGALRKSVTADAPLRTAVARAMLTAADLLWKEGKAQQAAELCDALGEADVPPAIAVAALHGQIRARGEDGLARLVDFLESDDEVRFRVGLRMAHELGGPKVAKAVVDVLELSEGSEEPEVGLVVEKAQYGAGDRWVDVTGPVAAAMRSGAAIEASNRLAGDPASGVVKKLKVIVRKDGQRQTIEVPEGDRLTLEGDMAAHPRQVLLIYTLGDLGEPVALPKVLEAAESDAWDIRLAAIRVLPKLGDARAVPVLLAEAIDLQSGLTQAARDSLVALSGEEVNAALVEKLAGAESAQLPVLIELVGRRGAQAAVPELLKLAESDETDVQQAAIGALGTTVGLEKLSALIEHLVDPASPEVASAAKDALKRAVQRMPDRDKTARLLDTAMAEASTETKIDLLDVLGVVGGPVALEAVGSAAESGDEPLVDAATRLLGEWLSPDAAPVLLHLAKTLDSEKYQIRALRGYVRIIRQLRLDDDEKVAMSRNAMDVAGRPAEKRLVLQALGRVPTAGALELIMAHLDDPQLRQRAAASAVAVAEKMPSPGEEVASAMKKVLDVSESDDVKHKARQVLKRIGQ